MHNILKKKIINLFIKIESYHKKFNWEFFFFFIRFLYYIKKKIYISLKIKLTQSIWNIYIYYKNIYFIFLNNYLYYVNKNYSSFIKLNLLHKKYLFILFSFGSLIKWSFNFFLILILRLYISIVLYNFVLLPIKKNKITVLSSPHVNKTAREQFEIKKYCQIFKLTLFNNFFLIFLYQLYCLPLKIQLFFNFDLK